MKSRGRNEKKIISIQARRKHGHDSIKANVAVKWAYIENGKNRNEDEWEIKRKEFYANLLHVISNVEEAAGMISERTFWVVPASRATAFVDDHFWQIAFDDVHVGTEINERHAGEFGWCATRL